MLTGHWEYVVILFAVALLFGSRLPRLLHRFGKTVGALDRELKDMRNQVAKLPGPRRDHDRPAEIPPPEDLAG